MGLALVQLYNVTLISSQEQAKRMNEADAKKREDARNKLKNASDEEVYDLLKNKDLLEWSRSDSPVRMYLREMGQIPLLTKEEEIEISKQIETGEDVILDAICSDPYLIDFILEYKEPLVNRERKVKELFRNFDDEDSDDNDTTEEVEETEDSEEVDEDGGKKKKQKKLDKRAE